MDYQIGRPGRVIVARGFDGEQIYEQIERLAAKEQVRSAAVILIGGVGAAKVVVGPKRTTGPIAPQFVQFDDAREVAGVGTIFCDESGPKLHLHSAFGRGREALVGCPRGGASVFCVLEVVIIEIDGIDAARTLDPQTGLELLALAGNNNSGAGR